MPVRGTRTKGSLWGRMRTERLRRRFLAAVPAMDGLMLLAPALTITLVVLTVFFTAVALNVPYEADHASMMVMGKAILQGNPLLEGWSLGNQAYYTTELPFYALGILLMDFTWKVMYVLTGLHWAMLAMMAVLLSVPRPSDPQIRTGVLIALCLTMFMPALLVNTLYLSNAHLVGFFYCMIAVQAVRNAERGISTPGYVVYAVFLTLALIGDVFPVFVLAAPVLLIGGARALLQEPRRPWLILVGLTVLSMVVSRAGLALIASAGGAQIPGPPASFIALGGLENNIYLFLQQSLELFAVKVFGLPVASWESGIGLLHLSGMLLFFLATYHYARRIQREDFYTQLLVAIVVASVAANLLSNAVRPGTTRYLAPVLLFGIPLVRRFIQESVLFARRRLLVFAYLVILAVSLIPPLTFSKPISQGDGLARMLVQLHLENGYGPYWRSNSVTVATAGQVTVRPVLLNEAGGISPCRCFADEDWYQSPASFLVVNTDDTSGLQPGVEDARRNFGEPAASYTLGKFGYLLVWDHDITPYLSHP